MIDTYTPDEFARCYSLRGYGRKGEAAEWMLERRMELATEADFERCYHELNAPKIASRRIGLWCDGQNPSDPQHAPNSSGKSYNAEMMRAQREIDSTERWIRKKMEQTEE